jgi:hypothetical protein
MPDIALGERYSRRMSFLDRSDSSRAARNLYVPGHLQRMAIEAQHVERLVEHDCARRPRESSTSAGVVAWSRTS